MNHDRMQIKKLIAFAQFVRKQYRRRERPRDIRWHKHTVVVLEEIEQKIDRANQLGFDLAHCRLISSFQSELEQIRSEIGSVLEELEHESLFVAKVNEIVRDLASLREEFNRFDYSIDNQTLSVVTEPIELEETHLGAFKILLDVATLSPTNGFYEIIALDPNSAASNSDINHPHVEGTKLCAGDGKHAIKLALQQGRLLDFFQLVDRVLKTYNPASAYCSLAEWNERTCDDCGGLCDSNHSYCCEKCECNVCDSCMFRCSDCEESFCGECNRCCSGCLDDLCPACVKECDQCGENFCSDCFSENERCRSCDEKINDENEEADESELSVGCKSDSGTETSVHANRVGQAAVLA